MTISDHRIKTGLGNHDHLNGHDSILPAPLTPPTSEPRIPNAVTSPESFPLLLTHTRKPGSLWNIATTGAKLLTTLSAMNEDPSYQLGIQLGSVFKEIDQLATYEEKFLGAWEAFDEADLATLENFRIDLAGNAKTNINHLESEVARYKTLEEGSRGHLYDAGGISGIGQDLGPDPKWVGPREGAARERLASAQDFLSFIENVELSPAKLEEAKEKLAGILSQLRQAKNQELGDIIARTLADAKRIPAKYGEDDLANLERELDLLLTQDKQAPTERFYAIVASAEDIGRGRYVEARNHEIKSMIPTVRAGDNFASAAAKLGAITRPMSYGALHAGTHEGEKVAAIQREYQVAHDLYMAGRPQEAMEKFTQLEGQYSEVLKSKFRQAEWRTFGGMVSVTVVTGFVSGFAAGAATRFALGAELVEAGSVGMHFTRNGTAALFFVPTAHVMNHAAWEKPIYDSSKSLLRNGLEFAQEVAITTALFAYLGWIGNMAKGGSQGLMNHAKQSLAQAARLRALRTGAGLGERAKTMLMGDLVAEEYRLLAEGIGGHLGVGAHAFTAELLAFTGWEFGKATVAEALSAAQDPNYDFNLLRATQQSLTPAAIKEQFFFLVALKAGNGLAKPLAAPLGKRFEVFGQKFGKHYLRRSQGNDGNPPQGGLKGLWEDLTSAIRDTLGEFEVAALTGGGRATIPAAKPQAAANLPTGPEKMKSLEMSGEPKSGEKAPPTDLVKIEPAPLKVPPPQLSFWEGIFQLFGLKLLYDFALSLSGKKPLAVAISQLPAKELSPHERVLYRRDGRRNDQIRSHYHCKLNDEIVAKIATGVKKSSRTVQVDVQESAKYEALVDKFGGDEFTYIIREHPDATEAEVLSWMDHYDLPLRERFEVLQRWERGESYARALLDPEVVKLLKQDSYDYRSAMSLFVKLKMQEAKGFLEHPLKEAMKGNQSLFVSDDIISLAIEGLIKLGDSSLVVDYLTFQRNKTKKGEWYEGYRYAYLHPEYSLVEAFPAQQPIPNAEWAYSTKFPSVEEAIIEIERLEAAKRTEILNGIAERYHWGNAKNRLACAAILQHFGQVEKAREILEYVIKSDSDYLTQIEAHKMRAELGIRPDLSWEELSKLRPRAEYHPADHALAELALTLGDSAVAKDFALKALITADARSAPTYELLLDKIDPHWWKEAPAPKPGVDEPRSIDQYRQ